MTLLILAAGASFLAGTFGYVLVVFWLRPVARYQKLRRSVAGSIAAYYRQAESEDPRARSALGKQLRQQASRITDCYNGQLPQWYQTLLKRRAEYPLEAAKHLLALAGTRKAIDAEKRIDKIRRALGLMNRASRE